MSHVKLIASAVTAAMVAALSLRHRAGNRARLSTKHRNPPKGQRCIAVLAPCGDAAASYPHMTQLGIRRLETLLGLPVLLMPSALSPSNSPEARAKDLNKAFENPDVVAIVCTIGGCDGVRVLPYLSKEIIANNRTKPLCGYSDVTSLILFLSNLGVPCLYGPMLLCQFANFGPDMHAYTAASFKHALCTPEAPLHVRPSKGFQDGYLPWKDESLMDVAKPLEKNDGFLWVGWEGEANTASVVEGKLWGGCLSVLYSHFATRKYLDNISSIIGAVLFVETCEIFPSSYTVYSFFQSLGEIGLLSQFSAILIGRPQTVCRGRKPSIGREAYVTDQRAAVIQALDEYCPTSVRRPPCIFNVDFGHTDPQVVVPFGGLARMEPVYKKTSEGLKIDPKGSKLLFHYTHKKI